MKALFLTGVAALFLTTGTVHAQVKKASPEQVSFLELVVLPAILFLILMYLGWLLGDGGLPDYSPPFL
jgi:hypothetical protein